LELRREVHIELELKETFFEKRREGRSLFLARREEKVGEHFERKFGNEQDTRVNRKGTQEIHTTMLCLEIGDQAEEETTSREAGGEWDSEPVESFT
jgi:hypothetical protein